MTENVQPEGVLELGADVATVPDISLGVDQE